MWKGSKQQRLQQPQPMSPPTVTTTTVHVSSGYPGQVHPNQPFNVGYPPPMYPGPTSSHMINQQPASEAFNQGDEWYMRPNIYYFFANAIKFQVRQKVEFKDVLSSWEMRKKYIITDQTGINVMYAAEVPDCCRMDICGASDAFVINIKDSNGVDLFRIERQFDCSCCCNCCCSNKLTVHTTGGQLLGSVTGSSGLFYRKFRLRDDSHATILKVRGPSCVSSGSGQEPPKFKILSADGTKIGTINKEWSRPVNELSTEPDSFGVSFPTSLTPAMKAVALACSFMLVSI